MSFLIGKKNTVFDCSSVLKFLLTIVLSILKVYMLYLCVIFSVDEMPLKKAFFIGSVC